MLPVVAVPGGAQQAEDRRDRPEADGSWRRRQGGRQAADGNGDGDEGICAMAETERAAAPRDPDDLVREIERTRENLAQTIDALTERVSPGQVARRALDRAREQLASPEGMLIGGAATVVALGVAVYLWRRRR